MRTAVNIALVVLAATLFITGVLTYPDVPGLVVLAMVITGALMVAPVGSRQSRAVEVTKR